MAKRGTLQQIAALARLQVEANYFEDLKQKQRQADSVQVLTGTYQGVDQLTGQTLIETVEGVSVNVGFAFFDTASPPAVGDEIVATFGQGASRVFVQKRGSSASGGNPVVSSSPGTTLGTITSVSLAVPGFLEVSGSPASEGAAAIEISLVDQAAGTFFAGPADGVDSSPGFRTIAIADIVGLFAEGANIALSVVDGALQISASGSGAQLYEPLTNGDPDDPQLLFDQNGDVLMGY